MMLAETIATNINWTLIATIIMAVGTVGMWLDARRQAAKPTAPVQVEQPLQVQKIWPAASLAELRDGLKQTNDRIDRQQEQIGKISEIIRCEIPEMERRLAEAGEERATKIHGRINDVLREVSKIEGYCQRNHGNT